MSIFRQEGVSDASAAALDNDAAYVIRPIEYVDTSPPLKTSLFDHPERLEGLWEAVQNSFRVEESNDERERRVEMARTILREVETAMHSANGNGGSEETSGDTHVMGPDVTG